ncbi:hypothetical protein DEEACLCL_00074 [Salmonella phage CRW-SP2]|nr:hypothetical protein DEEACLCL_00074 [Salmonella phage CRW-SP2]
MAMQRIEDMNNIDLEALVSDLLEVDSKASPEHLSFDNFCEMMGSSQQGFQRGELNIISTGGRP